MKEEDRKKLLDQALAAVPSANPNPANPTVPPPPPPAPAPSAHP